MLRLKTLAPSVLVFALLAPRVSSATQCPPYTTQWGGGCTNAPGDFQQDLGVAVSADGHFVYVADAGNYRIQRLTNGGVPVWTFGTQGTGVGQFKGVLSVAVGQDGTIYAADFVLHKVVVIDPSGAFVREFRVGNSTPEGIAADGSSNLFLTDRDNDRVIEYSNTGALVRTWGSFGGGNGMFRSPYGIAADNADNIFVADQGNYRIQEFTNTGAYVAQWGTNGSGDGQFRTLMGLGTDPAGNVYAVDAGKYNGPVVNIFTSAGEFMCAFGIFYDGVSPGSYAGPSGVAVGPDGIVYTNDQCRIEVWGALATPVVRATWGSVKTLYRN